MSASMHFVARAGLDWRGAGAAAGFVVAGCAAADDPEVGQTDVEGTQAEEIHGED